jgi:hypothetical protein
MNRQKITFVPNEVFDEYLRELKGIELKLLLIIIRQTIGWHDKSGGRKQSDWISSSQLISKTGSSTRAITSATDALVSRKLIEVFSDAGELLDTPEKRKGKKRLYYRLANLFQPFPPSPGFGRAGVDYEGKE